MADKRPGPSHAPSRSSEEPSHDVPRRLTSRRRPRFTLRTLLAAMTVVALGAVIVPAVGINALVSAAYLTMSFAFPVCLVAAASYTRGSLQTVFIGAACWACLSTAAARGLRLTGGLAALAVALALQLATYALAGGLALATRRFIERRGWDSRLRDGDSGVNE